MTPTAIEYLLSIHNGYETIIDLDYHLSDTNSYIITDIMNWMTEFAKLHVQAALEAAANKAETYTQTFGSPHMSEWTKEIDRSSIRLAYPLENIK